MKKRKLPGDNISLKTKKNESVEVMEWLNCQSNLMDSLRYLIENEIRLNGVRNLQHHIPSDRAVFPPGPDQDKEAKERDVPKKREREQEGRPVADVPPAAVPVIARNIEDEIDEEDIDTWL